jgi:hypothetical protein
MPNSACGAFAPPRSWRSDSVEAGVTGVQTVARGYCRQAVRQGAYEENMALWKCLYLIFKEILWFLKTVCANATEPVSFLLHAILVYTGMRHG